MIVEVVPDNLNRTASEVPCHIFDKCGVVPGRDRLGVSWKFERKGVIVVDNSKGLDEDELMMLALDCGAADVETDSDSAAICTDPADISPLCAISWKRRVVRSCTAERAMIPTTTTALPDEESVEKVTRLLDWLEDYEDTESVYHDAELPEEEDEDE